MKNLKEVRTDFRLYTKNAHFQLSIIGCIQLHVVQMHTFSFLSIIKLIPSMSKMINDTPSANDVLIGRGRRNQNHSGNQRYQSIIKSLKPEYDAAPKSLRGLYGKQIINLIHNLSPPGRFLRKDKVSGSWIELDTKEAVQRGIQALHDSKQLVVRTPATPPPFPAGEVVSASGTLSTRNKFLIQQYDGFQVSTSNDTDNSRFSIRIY